MSQESIIKLLTSGLTKDQENSMWVKRAEYLMEALMPALVYMREQEETLIDIELIQDYLILENIINLYKTRRDFPNNIRSSLKNYLHSLPGFVENEVKQSNTVLEQHGYLQMQYTLILSNLKKIENENIVIIPNKLLNYIYDIKHYTPKGMSFSKKEKINSFKTKIFLMWENMDKSNFLNLEIIHLIWENKKSLHNKDLTLYDLISLSLEYMDENKRDKLFELIFLFAKNLKLMKSYSEELKYLIDSGELYNHMK